MYKDFRVTILNFFRKFSKLLAGSTLFKFKGHLSVAVCFESYCEIKVC